MWTGSSPLHICVAPRERSLACRAVRSLHLSRSRSPRPHPWNRQRATASAQHAGGHCVEAPCCSCCVVLEKEAVASLRNVPEVAQEAERPQRRRAPPSRGVLTPSYSPHCAPRNLEIARDQWTIPPRVGLIIAQFDALPRTPWEGPEVHWPTPRRRCVPQ